MQSSRLNEGCVKAEYVYLASEPEEGRTVCRRIARIGMRTANTDRLQLRSVKQLHASYSRRCGVRQMHRPILVMSRMHLAL